MCASLSMVDEHLVCLHIRVWMELHLLAKTCVGRAGAGVSCAVLYVGEALTGGGIDGGGDGHADGRADRWAGGRMD